MPFKSEAQRRYLYANEPDIAKRWEREYGTSTDLPERVGRKKPAKRSPLKAAWSRTSSRFSR